MVSVSTTCKVSYLVLSVSLSTPSSQAAKLEAGYIDYFCNFYDLSSILACDILPHEFIPLFLCMESSELFLM